MNEKLALDLLVLGLFILASILLFKYFKHEMGTQVEAEDDANMKRLFGEAWKEAKNL